MVKERRPRKLKDDDDVSPITLIMRQYYNNDAHKRKIAKKKERYDNDPEYRENVKLKAMLYYYKRKEEKLKEEEALYQNLQAFCCDSG